MVRGRVQAQSIQISLLLLVAGVLAGSCSGDDDGDEKSATSTGARGGRGDAGAPSQGDGGADGTAGTARTAGTTGMTGAAGDLGTAGSSGPAGAAGTPGAAGIAGSQGSDGTGGTGAGNDGSGGEPGVGGTGAAGANGAAGSASEAYVCEPACADGQMCCPTGVHTECVPIDVDGCGVPDLVIDEAAAASSVDVTYVNVAADPCLLEEACVGGGGWRRVLTFDTTTPNIGTGDLVVGAPSMGNPDFEYSTCHGHYHFSGYAVYDLLDTNGNLVASGHKQAFCLRDDEQILNEPGVRTQKFYTCSNQGISRGWSDVYFVGLPCQWVDITDVPAGDYELRIRINPTKRIYELDYDNNELIVAVTIPP